jgi:hypothetical protein
MSMTRKQFIGSLLGGAALLACGGDDSTPDSGMAMRNCAMNGTNVTIGSNHGHVMTVTSSDVTTGAAKTYDIRGTADHTHTVMVASANFATLQSNANGSVMLTSSTDNGHSHSITIICA